MILKQWNKKYSLSRLCSPMLKSLLLADEQIHHIYFLHNRITFDTSLFNVRTQVRVEPRTHGMSYAMKITRR